MPRLSRSSLLPLLAILTLPFLPSCINVEVITPTGPAVSTERNPGDFIRVHASGGFTYVLEAAETPGCTVEAPENMQNCIVVTVEDGELCIRKRDRVEFFGGSQVTVHVRYRTLEALCVSGGSTVTSGETIRAGAFSHEVSGGSRSTLLVAGARCTLILSGGSVASLTGGAGDCDVSSSGGSVLHASAFPMDRCAVNISGGGTAELRVDGLLTVDASGGSHVRYVGNPRLGAIALSGGSTLRRTN
jgi:hypothetical protein